MICKYENKIFFFFNNYCLFRVNFALALTGFITCTPKLMKNMKKI